MGRKYDYWNDDERDAFEEGERDARRGGYDWSRSRYDGPCDQAYFDGYDTQHQREEDCRREQREEEEAEQRAAERRAHQRYEEEQQEEAYYLTQQQEECEPCPEPPDPEAQVKESPDA